MVKLHPHQQDAIAQLHNGAILWGDVGTGKSITAAAYYIKKEAPRDVYVITTAKKRDSNDWVGEFAKFGVGMAKDATVAGVLTIDSWNNIYKYTKTKNAFFIFDEQRLVGAGAWVDSFLKIVQNNRWVMLTATPGDTWLDYVPIFIANGYYKNRSEFRREHVVYKPYSKFPKVERYTGVGRLVRLRNEILVEMPYERHTVRHETTIPVDYDVHLFNKAVKERWNPYENRPMKDVAELFRVMRKVVYSDESRLDALSMLMEKHPRLIVFYNFDYELEKLRSLLKSLGATERGTTSPSGTSEPERRESWPTQPPASTTSSTRSSRKLSSSISSVSVVEPTSAGWGRKRKGPTSTTAPTSPGSELHVAEWNGHKHDPVPTGERWVYLVQYTAGAEGWNCTTTDAMVFYSLTYSYKLWHQGHGRIDRINTPYIGLYYYVLMSNSVIDRMVWKALRDKQNFNEQKVEKFLTDLTAKSGQNFGRK